MRTLGGDIIKRSQSKLINQVEDLKKDLSRYHIMGTKIKFNVLRSRKTVEIELVY